MKLSPKAIRFVKEAIDELPNYRPVVDIDSLSGELSHDVIALAIEAINQSRSRIEGKLAERNLSDDERSDLANDLRYLMSVERDIDRETKRMDV
jgi:hypothetical protein